VSAGENSANVAAHHSNHDQIGTRGVSTRCASGRATLRNNDVAAKRTNHNAALSTSYRFTSPLFNTY